MVNDEKAAKGSYPPERQELMKILDDFLSEVTSTYYRINSMEIKYKDADSLPKEGKERFQKDVYEMLKNDESDKRRFDDFVAGLKELDDPELQKKAEFVKKEYATAHSKIEAFAKSKGATSGWQETMYG